MGESAVLEGVVGVECLCRWVAQVGVYWVARVSENTHKSSLLTGLSCQCVAIPHKDSPHVVTFNLIVSK